MPYLLSTPIAALSGMSSGSAKSSTRLTAAQKEEMNKGIVAFLSKNPWAKKAEIAEAVGYDASKVYTRLQALRKDKKITSVGDRAATCYATKGEKSKAPA